MKEPKPLTRKEAIMLGYDVPPMSREEALLTPQVAAENNLKVFTRDEMFRVNCYDRISGESSQEPISPGNPVSATPLQNPESNP